MRLNGFFRDIAISSVLNRFCSAGRAFRDKFFILMIRFDDSKITAATVVPQSELTPSVAALFK